MSEVCYACMVDLGTASTLLVAIATMAVASVSYASVRQNRRQVNMLVRQTMLLKTQQDPIPLIKAFSFDKNTLKITLENAGNGPASSLAIGSSFVLARHAFFADSRGERPLSSSEFEDASKEKKQVFMRYELEVQRNLQDEGKKVFPTPVACQLINEERDTTLLLPHETCTYSLDLKFGLGPKSGDPTSFPPFDPLVGLLKENGITCFTVDFDLIGKNMAEDPIQRQRIGMFVVDLAKHKNLEEAFAEKTRPYFMPLDSMEVARTIPLSVEMYLQSKSMVNYPRYFEEGKTW
jgi:hypothetical protein